MTRTQRGIANELSKDELSAAEWMVKYLSGTFKRDELNPWELEFLISIEAELNKSHPFLTRNQYTKLQEVFENH